MERAGGIDRKLLPSLTGLRAVAALAVFASHVWWVLPTVPVFENESHRITSSDILNFGAQGVTLFFVLSGFVLAWGASGPTAPMPFYGRRFARVWPAHATMWLVFMIMGVLGIASATAPLPAVTNLLLVQTWIPGLGWANSANPLAWTLSCEAFFYLMFPVMYSMIRNLRPRELIAVAAACVVFGAAINIAFLVPRGIVVSTFPPFRFWEFVLGAVAAVATRRGLVRRTVPSVLVVGVLVLVLLASKWFPGVEALASFVPALCFVLLVNSLALRDSQFAGDSRSKPLLANSAAQYGGRLSYGFYLVQLAPLAVITFIVDKPEGFLQRSSVVIIWFLSTLASAMMLYHGVERPAVRRLLKQQPFNVRVPELGDAR